MLIVRAWPDHPPAGRPYVVDGWRRVPVDDYDYRGLAGLGEDVVSMDWDTAVSREDLAAFCGHAAERPGDCLAAPMRMYGRTPAPWNLGVYPSPEAGDLVEIGEGQDAHLFGFGLVYLPHKLITGYIAAQPDTRLTDVWFGDWHHRNVTPFCRVDWSVRPVHLHYPESESGKIPAAA